MKDISVGFALCGSFCTFQKALEQMRLLVSSGARVTPIMSENAYSTDTRFGTAEHFINEIESICGEKIIHTISSAEPVGPKKMFDVLLVEPCTGNTLGKLANGITDTAVTMACKSHLRNSRPLVLAVSTNDALGNSARNIGALLNYKNVYFVPMKQDDHTNKPRSVVAEFSQTQGAILSALDGRQVQPVFC